MKRGLIILMFGLLVPWFASAQAGISTDQARQLMQLSGMSAQIDEVPLMLGMTLQQQQAQLQMPDWQLQALSDALEAGFQPEPMKNDVRGHLEDRLSAGDADAAIAWLESPLGQRVTELEGRAAEPAVQQEIMQRLQSGDAADVSDDRQGLLERFDEATRASDMSVEMVIGIQHGLVSAILQAAGAPAEQLDMALGQLEAARPQIATAVAAQNQATFGVIYRDLSDAEMADYVEFAESGAGRAYHEAMFTGFADAMESAATRSGEAMAAAAR